MLQCAALGQESLLQHSSEKQKRENRTKQCGAVLAQSKRKQMFICDLSRNWLATYLKL